MKSLSITICLLLVCAIGFSQQDKKESLPSTENSMGIKVNKPGDPLFVIDDVVYAKNDSIGKDKLHHIDPNTIESITVHKEKSATDLFGEHGKDGLIVIVTKEFSRKQRIKEN